MVKHTIRPVPEKGLEFRLVLNEYDEVVLMAKDNANWDWIIATVRNNGVLELEGGLRSDDDNEGVKGIQLEGEYIKTIKGESYEA